jgi:hypothetical protein
MPCFPHVPADHQKRKSTSSFVLPLFWSGLLKMASEPGMLLHKNCRPHSGNRLGADVGQPGIKLNYTVWTDGSAFELLIDTGSQQKNKHIFDRLRNQKTKIVVRFKGLLVWDRQNQQRPSRIRFTIPGGGLKDRVRWTYLQERLVKVMKLFAEVLTPGIHASVSADMRLARVA